MLYEGEQVGPYVVIEQLGSGGMASVYKAYHAKLDRHVAIKVMHQAFLEDKSFQARFEREAQIVARLEHRNIVPIYDFSEHKKQPYLVMKYIEGRTLKAILTEDGALSAGEIRQIMTPLADALTYAHEQGVLHRDIKPSNIILDEHGVPYLTDFGLARILQAGESTISHDMLLGTPQYISPEQAKGGIELDARTDVYSLGVVLYELVVGRVPFGADTPYAIVHDHIYTPLPIPSKINPDVPPEVEKVLLRALAKAPKDRYNSAREMMAAFNQAIESSGGLDLKADRVTSQAISRARQAAQPDADFEPAIPSPLQAPRPPRPPTPPDPQVDPGGYARWQVENVRVQVSEALVKAFGSERAGKLEGALGWLETRALEAIEKQLEQGNLMLSDEGELIRKKDKKVVLQIDMPDKKPTAKAGNAKPAWAAKEAEPDADDGEYRELNDLSEAGIRQRVERRFRRRSELFTNMGMYIMVIVLLTVIWSITKQWGGIFMVPWPLLVLFGWGSGLASDAVEVYFETGKRAEQLEDEITRELRLTYGDNWNRMISSDEYAKVRKRVTKDYRKRTEFYRDAPVYVIINIMLWLIWYYTHGSGGIFQFPWPVIVMIGWGIGLVEEAIRAVTQTGARTRARERAIQRELERQGLASPASLAEKAKRTSDDREKRKMEDLDPVIRLTEDGELTESFAEEWQEEQNRKRRQ